MDFLDVRLRAPSGSLSALAAFYSERLGIEEADGTTLAIGATGAGGPFAAAELLGLSELGLVGAPAPMADQLGRLGLELWDGTLDEPGRLAFVGERARTLILCPAGRGWLPTGRPAEPNAVEAVLSGSPEREAALEDSRYRIARGGRSRNR